MQQHIEKHSGIAKPITNIGAKKENPDINIQKHEPFARLHLIFIPQQKQQPPMAGELQKLALSHFRLVWIYSLIKLASAP